MPIPNGVKRTPTKHVSIYPPEDLLDRVKGILNRRGRGSMNQYFVDAAERQVEEDEAKN